MRHIALPSLVGALSMVLSCPSWAAGPYGHTILAQKAMEEIRSGAVAASPELRKALDDPDCRRAFCGGSVAPDLAEELHYGKTGELARNLVETANSNLQRAESDRDPAGEKRARRQLAFAYGWMTHVAADVEIHPVVNSFTGDSWSHNDKGEKLTHAAREGQLSAYLAKTYPSAATPFDVEIPYDFMSGVTGIPDAKLRQAMGVLKGKVAAELWAKSKVTQSPAQLEATWGAAVRASQSDTRELVSNPGGARNWDMDAGGKLTTEQFEALRNLVLQANGGKLPPSWASHYVQWFAAVRGMSPQARLARIKELMGGTPVAAVKPATGSGAGSIGIKIGGTVSGGPGPTGQKVLVKRIPWPNGRVHFEQYYIETSAGPRNHGTVREYYETGVLKSETSWAEGIPHGTNRYFHPNGKVSETGTYVHGKKEGPWIRYRENGEVDMKTVYVHDEAQ